jgi:hypothetical protein
LRPVPEAVLFLRKTALVGLDYNSGYIATKARLAEKSLSSWVQDVLRNAVK